MSCKTCKRAKIRIPLDIIKDVNPCPTCEVPLILQYHKDKKALATYLTDKESLFQRIANVESWGWHRTQTRGGPNNDDVMFSLKTMNPQLYKDIHNQMGLIKKYYKDYSEKYVSFFYAANYYDSLYKA